MNLRVFGDELYGRTETREGYTVVFKPEDKAYYYATIGSDGSLIASSLVVGRDAPPSSALGLRESISRVSAIREHNAKLYTPNRAQDWAVKVQAAALRRRPAGSIQPSPSATLDPAAAPVIGSRVGLLVLVQFPDDPATAAADPVKFPTDQSKMDRMCNEIGFQDDGNTGSVRQYYRDQSNGKLDLTHLVSPIVTVAHPRAYYNWSDYPKNSVLRDTGETGRLLTTDAIQTLQKTGFDFSSLSADGQNNVIVTSILFAGPDSGVWARGLWGHTYSLASPLSVGTPSNPRYIYGYQCSNMADSTVEIGVMCHELGHLVMGYPDLYDYGYESRGLGYFDLMAYGNWCNNAKCPAPIDLYLKEVSGWATITDLAPGDFVQTTLLSTGNGGVRLSNPGNSKEFFLVENRGDGDPWAAYSPGKGIAIWHVDEGEWGNNAQQMSVYLHYEVSLEQADGQFDLENNTNLGDANDLYNSGTGPFSDGTLPNAHWWDGTNSNYSIKAVTVSGSAMTVQFGAAAVPTITTQPSNTTIFSGQSATLEVVTSGSFGLVYQWYQGLSGDTQTPVGTGAASFVTGTLTQTTNYWVRITGSAGSLDSDTAKVTVLPAPTIAIQPQGSTIVSGQTAQMSVAANGSELTYQWYQGNRGETSSPLGYNSASLTTPVLTGQSNFWVRVSNPAGSVDSEVATVTVISLYKVTPTAGPNGGIRPGAAQRIRSGGSIGFTATPNRGFGVDRWLVNGTLAQTGGNSFTLYNVTANSTVRVEFKNAVAPTINIKTPFNGQRITSNTISVSGGAAGAGGISSVQVQRGDGSSFDPFQTANGTTNWSTQVTLAPGRNVIRAKSIDLTGNESLLATCTVTLLKPLTVSVNGPAAAGGTSPGSVSSGFLGSSMREPGVSYSITALAGKGNVFDRWSGSNGLSSLLPRLTFTMEPGLVLTAHFISNPFPSVAGTYTGVAIEQTDGSSRGLLTVSTGKQGAFTGSLLLSGSTHRFKGSFSNDGHATVAIPGKGATPSVLELTLDMSGASESVIGAFTTGEGSYLAQADLLPFTSKTPTALAGQYTVLIDPSEQSGTPAGYGYGAMRVGTKGTVRIAGKLGDGSPVSYGGSVNRKGDLAIYIANYYKRLGYFCGNLAYDSTAFAYFGQMQWVKPLRAGEVFYPAGFDTQVSMHGAPYSYSAGSSLLLGIPSAPGNGRITFSGGNLSSELTKTVIVSSAAKVLVDPSATDKLSLSISLKDGLFSGSFVDVAAGKKRTFGGALNLDQSLGAGTFLGNDQSGMVILKGSDTLTAQPWRRAL